MAAARVTKTITFSSAWQTGKMPKSAFPLSKNNSFRLGRGWEWCVHVLEARSVEYRLLVAFHPGKSEYLAWLTVVTGNDQGVLARLEFHRSHLGWHVHLKRNSVSDVPLGVVKQSGERLIDCDDDTGPIAGKGSAEMLAFKMFNVAVAEWALQ